MRAFFEELRRRAGEEGFMAVVEVCGFNDWLLKMLAEYGCRELVLIQARNRSRQKNDRRDANELGELLWMNRHRLLAHQRIPGLRRVEPASPVDAAARQLTALRWRLGRQRTRTLNRVHHLLLKHNLHQEAPTKGLQTKKAKVWLRQLALNAIDRLELDGLLAQWELADAQIHDVETQLARLRESHDKASLVGTLPGASAYSSLTIAARIGDFSRFPQPASLANYWGLTPSCRNSGEATQRLGSITKQGSALVRAMLSQLVIHALRRDAWLRAWYQKIKRRRGAKIARVAVMRRLATTLWHMLKHQEAYQAGGPPRRRLSCPS